MEEVSKYTENPPAFQGYATLIQWNVSNDGMMVKATLKSYSNVHPFKQYKAGTSGQRMHVALSQPSNNGEHVPLGAWETMLAWWSDDPKFGMKVHLRLDDGPDGASHHPLEGMQKGDELYLACWLIDEEDIVVPPPQTLAKKRGWSNLKPAQQAHTLCNDKMFQEWCSKEILKMGLSEQDNIVNTCVEVIRHRCNIQSRKEFSVDNENGLNARRKWSDLLKEFYEWKN